MMELDNQTFINVRHRTWSECTTVLKDVLAQLNGADFQIERCEIGGSLLSGASSGPFFNDIDALLYIPNSILIEEDLVAEIAHTLGAARFSVLTVPRFGQPTRVAHIKLPVDQGVTSFNVLDLWLVHSPFITMSPIWSKLFSNEEVIWQQKARAIVSLNLETTDYQKIKALQLAEARWRYCACYGLPLIEDLDQRAQIILEDLPIKGTPPPSIKGFIEQWASGVLSDSWFIRPLTQTPYEILQALSQKRIYLREPPPEPAWAAIAVGIQEQRSQIFYA